MKPMLTDQKIETCERNLQHVLKEIDMGRAVDHWLGKDDERQLYYLGMDNVPQLIEVLQNLKHYKSKVEEMKKALEWYADENNYEMVETHINEYSSETTSEAWIDSGERARQALKGVTQ